MHGVGRQDFSNQGGSRSARCLERPHLRIAMAVFREHQRLEWVGAASSPRSDAAVHPDFVALNGRAGVLDVDGILTTTRTPSDVVSLQS
jgi:hypothetical protein